jgi:hypothetical protein
MVLPPSWKSEVDKAIDEATGRHADAHDRAAEQNREIAARIETLTDELKRHNSKQETEEPRKRTYENWTMGGLIATAIFTCALASFSLWQTLETRWAYGPIKESADAANRGADITASLERPYIFFNPRPTKNATKDGPNDANPTISYYDLNVGRVPAVINWVSVQCLLVDSVPIAPMYPRDTFHDTLREIGPSNKDDSWQPCQFSAPFSPADWEDLQREKKVALFLVAIVYSGALDYTYFTTYGFRIDMFAGSAYAVGGSRYNRNGSIEGRITDTLPKELPDVIP